MENFLDFSGLSHYTEKIKAYFANLLNNKVDKLSGKELSTNDLTNALKQNYDSAYSHSTSTHAPTNAEKNTIIAIKQNGKNLTPDDNRIVDLGTVLTGGEQTSTSSADGGSNVYTFSDGSTITVKNGSKGSQGNPGKDGTNGTNGISVTVASVSESDTDGGNNTITFSDGTIITIKNGTKGDKGDAGTNATITAVATTSANGLMSKDDKSKLDGIDSEANKTIVDSILSSTSTNPVQNKIVKSELDKKLSAYGGILDGTIQSNGTVIVNRNSNGSTNFAGGTNLEDGASLILRGKTQPGIEGFFELIAKKDNATTSLIGTPDGNLQWGNVMLSSSGRLNVGGKVNVFTDNEGGSIDLVSADNKYGYQMDGCLSNALRLYAYQVSPWTYKADLLFYPETGILKANSFSGGGIIKYSDSEPTDLATDMFWIGNAT